MIRSSPSACHSGCIDANPRIEELRAPRFSHLGMSSLIIIGHPGGQQMQHPSIVHCVLSPGSRGRGHIPVVQDPGGNCFVKYEP